MQIKKEDFEALNNKVTDLQAELACVETQNKECTYRAVACDRILEKIVRAAEGLPLIDNPNGYRMTPGVGYERPHRCIPFTDEELKQGEIEGLREQAMMFAERLAAVKAIATFAKEHKL